MKDYLKLKMPGVYSCKHGQVYVEQTRWAIETTVTERSWNILLSYRQVSNLILLSVEYNLLVLHFIHSFIHSCIIVICHS